MKIGLGEISKSYLELLCGFLGHKLEIELKIDLGLTLVNVLSFDTQVNFLILK